MSNRHRHDNRQTLTELGLASARSPSSRKVRIVSSEKLFNSSCKFFWRTRFFVSAETESPKTPKVATLVGGETTSTSTSATTRRQTELTLKPPTAFVNGTTSTTVHKTFKRYSCFLTFESRSDFRLSLLWKKSSDIHPRQSLRKAGCIISACLYLTVCSFEN